MDVRHRGSHWLPGEDSVATVVGCSPLWGSSYLLAAWRPLACMHHRAQNSVLIRLALPQCFCPHARKLRPWSEKNSDQNSDHPRLCIYWGHEKLRPWSEFLGRENPDHGLSFGCFWGRGRRGGPQKLISHQWAPPCENADLGKAMGKGEGNKPCQPRPPKFRGWQCHPLNLGGPPRRKHCKTRVFRTLVREPLNLGGGMAPPKFRGYGLRGK